MKSHKLRDAVFRFDLNEIAQLLERGCGIDEIDEDGRTALMHAAIDGQSEISNFLIAKGANVNVQDGQGWTALHFAIQNGHNEIAFDLLDLRRSASEFPTPLALSGGSTGMVGPPPLMRQILKRHSESEDAAPSA